MCNRCACKRKTVIIYYSKTGFTERYARWLAQDLDCALFRYEERNKIDFRLSDVVIFGSWCHAGTIRKINWFRKQLPFWKGKKVAAFAVGAMPAGFAEIPELLRRNFTGDVRAFYLPGGLNYEKMGSASRIMMKLFSSMMAKKQGKTQAEEEMARAIAQSYDLSDRGNLRPLTEYVGESNA